MSPQATTSTAKSTALGTKAQATENQRWPRPSLLRASYRTASVLLGPFLNTVLERRAARGKEDRIRLSERRGVASLVRPAGNLVWVHVASVGESLSVLPLVNRLLDDDASLHVLVTSGTLTSARLLGSRLPERAFHQFIPLDRPAWVQRFIDSWRPNLALFVESELWPNLLEATRRSACPCVLVNGRVSTRSLERWLRFPGFIRALLNEFSLCLVQDEEQAQRFSALGAEAVLAVGNLKMIDGRETDRSKDLRAQLLGERTRPIWLAASTHAGEESLVLDLHNHLVRRVPGLLTMIALRHPDRREDVLNLLNQRGLRYATRSSGTAIEEDHEVFLIDTIGELPDFYALSRVALICGSLIPGIGGHNPIEALHRGTSVVMGPHVDNFAAIAEELMREGAIAQIDELDEAKSLLVSLMTDEPLRQRYSVASRRYLDRHLNVIDDSINALAPFLPRPVERGNELDDGKVVPLHG